MSTGAKIRLELALTHEQRENIRAFNRASERLRTMCAKTQQQLKAEIDKAAQVYFAYKQAQRDAERLRAESQEIDP